MVTQSPRDQKWEGTGLRFCLYRQDIDVCSELAGKAAQSCVSPCEHRGYACEDAGRGWACGSPSTPFYRELGFGVPLCSALGDILLA